jgi:hypothetical protein
MLISVYEALMPELRLTDSVEQIRGGNHILVDAIRLSAKKKNPITSKKLSDSIVYGVPESIRTTGPFLRREVLYPAELRGRV